jgi:hypothetical protein
MPFSPKQHHLFQAVAHGWTPPSGSGIKISREDATKMAHEGVKKPMHSEMMEGDRGKSTMAHESSESRAKKAAERKRKMQRQLAASR